MTPAGNMSQKVIAVPLLGDNSFQKVPIDTPNVKQLVIDAERSLGVASITFCYEPEPTPTDSPTASPVTSGAPVLPPVDMSMSMSM